MWSDVADNDTNLYCMRTGEDKKDHDCCGEWDLKNEFSDIEYLNPVSKGEIR